VLVLTLAERTMRLAGIPVGSNLWRRARAYAVFHDASEAYTGDITQPLKVMLGTAFSEIEDPCRARFTPGSASNGRSLPR
jgi:5'-deoxynucleotidase YfbR-like HD superfamily hydrolase